MPSDSSASRQRWLLIALTLFTFFFLLGTRSLNEPDEGRYAEVAREMLESGDWTVPHLWYEPHLDKPPITYWAVAVSMKLFGVNEWAARLPLALAGLSGVLAAGLLGTSIGGRRAGIWSVVILQTSLLYFAMARMLTTDIFLTQFITWAIYFFWRSWRSLDAPSGSVAHRSAARHSFFWQLAAWAAMAGGFLVKGPAALAIPLVAFLALMIYGRRDINHCGPILAGAPTGIGLFVIIVTPWFWRLGEAVPQALHYLVFGQAMGHLLGTTVRDRQGSPFYFFAVLAAGFMPWTLLLGWLWRRNHWRSLTAREREGWVLLSACTIFTFGLFSLSHAKLPAYILPLFPALSVMVALRWPGGGREQALPPWVWRVVMLCPLLLMVAVPVGLRFALHAWDPAWFWVMVGMGSAAAVLLVAVGWKWPADRCIRMAVALAIVNLFLTTAVIPSVESDLRGNQTLKPLGLALQREYRPGDILICENQFPQGLPFYSGSIINPTNRPYFAFLNTSRVPFEFTGNRDRFGPLILNVTTYRELLDGPTRVLVIGYNMDLATHHPWTPLHPLRPIYREGLWEIVSNR